MIPDATVTLCAERDPHAEAVILGGLEAHNLEKFGRADSRVLDVLLRDDSGAIIGGLLGHTSLGLFFLDLFYLPKPLRGRGLGSRIMSQAENEARARGCRTVFVFSITFHAPEFYERHGYRRFGEIVCPPDGAARIFLTKTLA